ncbi:MAG TPA: DOPA 4,5-dioxygenase family protein [Rhodopila sp.]|nr:DOPA 4,5-dioxygenase family protein [Rhodopila sp.]
MTQLHGYHAHIYYGDDSRRPVADELCNALAAQFPVELGRNSGIAGPHPVAQRQVIFRSSAFAEVVPWLMFNRQGLDILVHPLTDDEYDDHTANALWLGTPVPLKLDILPHGPYPAELLPSGP